MEADLDERLMRTRHGRRWRKFPDVQLGLYVAGTLEVRVRKGISAARIEQARIEKVRRNTAVAGSQRRTKSR